MLTRDLTAAKRSVATSGAMAEFALVFALGAQIKYEGGVWTRRMGPRQRATRQSEE
jgi:hypothetical protein